MKAISYEEIRNYIDGKNGNGCKLLISKEEFENQKILQKESNTHVLLKVQCKCGEVFYKCYHSFSAKDHPRKQCYNCGIKLRSKLIKKYDYNFEIEELKKLGYMVFDNEKIKKNYKNDRVATASYLHLIDNEGYKYKVDISSIRGCISGKSKGFNKFHSNNPYTIENTKLWLKNNEPSYKLLSDNYLKNIINMKWKCPKKHIFEMSLNKFQGGKRCPICNESKGEKRIRDYLQKNDVYIVPQKKFANLRGLANGKLSYDFYLPKYNLLIEYQGKFHDGTADIQTEEYFKMQQQNDYIKRNYAKDNNIKLLEIWYKDFENIEKILARELNICDLKEAK